MFIGFNYRMSLSSHMLKITLKCWNQELEAVVQRRRLLLQLLKFMQQIYLLRCLKKHRVIFKSSKMSSNIPIFINDSQILSQHRVSSSSKKDIRTGTIRLHLQFRCICSCGHPYLLLNSPQFKTFNETRYFSLPQCRKFMQ